MPRSGPTAPWGRRVMWVGGLLGAWAAVVAHAEAPVVVTTSAWLNGGLVAGLLVGLPLAAFWHGARLPHAWAKAAAILTLGPLTVACGALATFAAVMLPPQGTAYGGGGDFERVGQLRLPHSAVAAYRTNGGATTDFGIVVRQEREIVPGALLLVRRVYGRYHAHDAALASAGPGRVRVHVPAYGESPPVDTVVRAPRYIYFD